MGDTEQGEGGERKERERGGGGYRVREGVWRDLGESGGERGRKRE